jgi:hypothetical protein
MKILLIEDMAGFATPIAQELQAQGHQVTWIIGATRIELNGLTGILASRDAQPMEDSWSGESDRLIEVAFEDFDCALVDGGLIGPCSSGAGFVEALTRFGVPCVSITGGGAGIKLLADSGAVAGLPKEFVVLALRHGTLDVSQAKSNALALERTLSGFCQEMRSQMQQVRKGGQRFVTGYPALDAA